MKKAFFLIILFLVFIALFTLSCGSEKHKKEVVVYVSVDQNYSEPIIKSFETQTGIKVLAIYDVEAAKTTGLVNRLINEKNLPQADVFWNGEIIQTLLLKEKGVLTPINPQKVSNITRIPAAFRDPEYLWIAFGGRARVLIINTELVSPPDYPVSIFDMLDERFPGDRIGMAYPLFGTTATHAAALYALWGEEKAKTFFQKLEARDIRITDGNSVVRDLVADGTLMFGLTDTDDAISAAKKGAPVTIVLPDQKEHQQGTLIIPNTVAKIKGCPNPREAETFIDFLISRETEKKLLDAGWFHFSLHSRQPFSQYFKADNVKTMDTRFEDIYKYLDMVKRDLRTIFIR